MTRLELAGKCALVTGAAGGIGAAVADRLSGAGAHVIRTDLRPNPGIEAVDVADDASVAQLADAAISGYGAVDIVIHSAAICLPGGILTTKPDDFAAQYDVNVLGAVRLIQHLAPAMIARGSGNFVMLSSINARFATPTLAAYAASKAALESVVRTAAIELAPHGVRINAIAPASIDTPMLRQSFDRATDPGHARARNVTRHPLGRLGTAADVAELAMFLASDRAGWITGGIFPLDGGASVQRA